MDRHPLEAYVDTTILVDVLLKTGAAPKRAKAGLAKYESTRLPAYAIKELQLGALENYIWLRNKLVTTRSYDATLRVVGRLAGFKRYRVAIALDEMTELGHRLLQTTFQDAAEKYGGGKTPDEVLAATIERTLTLRILGAWKKRRQVTTSVVDECACFLESAPVLRDGIIKIRNPDCTEGDCRLRAALVARPDDLLALEKVSRKDTRSEGKKRAKVLHDLQRKPKDLGRKQCRALGDAVFAFFAPETCAILTTNTKDHQPLAAALGKEARSPDDDP